MWELLFFINAPDLVGYYSQTIHIFFWNHGSKIQKFLIISIFTFNLYTFIYILISSRTKFHIIYSTKKFDLVLNSHEIKYCKRKRERRLIEMNNILKSLRLQAGLTQEQVAELVDVTTNTVQNWERNYKFSTSEQLHKLLDIYNVDEITRLKVILAVYSRKNDSLHLIVDSSYDLFADKELLLQYYTNILSALENRMMSVECTIDYLDNHKPAFTRKTAKIIDLIASEYNIILNAEEEFNVYCFNANINTLFPFCDFMPMPISEYDRYMTYDEYINKKNCELHSCHKRTQEKALNDAIKKIKKNYNALSKLYNYFLHYIADTYASDDISVTDEIDVDSNEMYKVLTILPAGKRYKIYSLKEAGKNTTIQDSTLQNSNYTYCDASFIDKNTITKIVEAIKTELLQYNISDSQKIEYN